MRLGKDYFIDNSRIVWADTTGHTTEKTAQKTRVQRMSAAVETFGVGTLGRGMANSSSSNRSFKDILRIQSNDAIAPNYPKNDPNDPEAPFLRQQRFNRLLDGGIHMLIDYDFRKLPKIEVKDNTLTVEIDKPYSLGEYSGKPTAMRVLSYGGLDSCVQMVGKSTPEELASNKVTLLDRAFSDFPNQYNASDRKAIREKSIFIHGLVSVARGMDDVKYFKQLMRQEKLDVRKELEALGFDLSKDFTVNGKKFVFKNGDLTLVNTA